jgi:fructose-1-phosphate kinase PfkB-like protein
MTPRDLSHFLIVYRVADENVEITEYPGAEYDEAQDAYQALEHKYRDDEGVEVVLLSADSREALMETHGRFFDASRKHVDDNITERLDELLEASRG